jgi:hypothetical protein
MVMLRVKPTSSSSGRHYRHASDVVTSNTTMARRGSDRKHTTMICC